MRNEGRERLAVAMRRQKELFGLNCARRHAVARDAGLGGEAATPTGVPPGFVEAHLPGANGGNMHLRRHRELNESPIRLPRKHLPLTHR